MERMWLALALSWALAVLMGPPVIGALRRLRVGQAVRKEGPARHLSKTGTPTMGGVLFLVPMLLTGLLLGGRSVPLWTVAGTTVAYALLGAADDFLKVVRRHPQGLRARYKLLGQVLVAVALGYVVMVILGEPPWVRVPLVDRWLYLGAWYLPFLTVVLVGTANAVNLTDGLDGLAAGTAAIAFLFYTFVNWQAGRVDLALWCAAGVGGLLGFLRYNWHPARVMMGDTGSMGLGAALGAVAILSRTELLWFIAGGVFVVEALSVMLQVAAFQTVGRRIFRMSPLHHHFELAGHGERSVVLGFWVAGALLAVVAWLAWRGVGW